MATPSNDGSTPSTKSLKCSTEVHEVIMRLVDDRGTNVDSVLRELTDPATVRIPMMPGQRERWDDAAGRTGMPLPVWIVTRVEGALLYGADRGSIELIYRHVRDMRAHLIGRPLGDEPPQPRISVT